MKLLLPIIVGAGGLYLASRLRGAGGAVVGNGASPPAGASPLAGGTAPVADPRFNGTGIVQKSGQVITAPIDVAPPDLEATKERDVFLDNQMTQSTLVGWRDRFNRQVMRPAQLLSITDLTQDDFNNAIALIDGTLPMATGDNRSDSFKKKSDLTADDAFAAELWTIVSTIVAAVGSIFTFGLAGVAVGAIDLALKSDFDDINAAQAASKKVQGSLSGTDLATLKKWLGPVMYCGSKDPTNGYNSDSPNAPPMSFDQDTSSGVAKPIWMRSPLFSQSAGDWRLRWTSDQICAGRTLRQKVNIRARMLRALDVLGCQLFPWPDPYDVAVADAPGLYTYNNAALKGPKGTNNGWLKGSIFRPMAGDLTYAGYIAFHQAATTVFVPPSVAIKNAGGVAINAPAPSLPVSTTVLNPPGTVPGIELMGDSVPSTPFPAPAPAPAPRVPAPRPPPKPIGDGDTVHPIGKVLSP